MHEQLQVECKLDFRLSGWPVCSFLETTRQQRYFFPGVCSARSFFAIIAVDLFLARFVIVDMVWVRTGGGIDPLNYLLFHELPSD